MENGKFTKWKMENYGKWKILNNGKFLIMEKQFKKIFGKNGKNKG